MTREQNRAKYAYEATSKVSKEVREDYTNMALRFPALVRSAGLAQAFAFVLSRGKEGHVKFINDLACALFKLDVKGGSDPIDMECVRAEDWRSENAADEYFKIVRIAKLPVYIRMTREVLAMADWFKRFVQSAPESDSESKHEKPAT